MSARAARALAPADVGEETAGEEAASEETASDETGIPSPKMKWDEFVMAMCVLADGYNAPVVTPEKKKKYRTRRNLIENSPRSMKQLKEAFSFIEEEVFWGPEKGFFMGLPLFLFASGFPTLMKSIMDAVIQLMPLFMNGMAMWGYTAGFIDGDGSIYGTLRQITRPEVEVALGNDATYHKLLQMAGFASSKEKVRLAVNKTNFFPEKDDESAGAKERLTMVQSFTQFLVFRRVQWLVLFLFSGMARLGMKTVILTDRMEYARCTLPWVLSSLNHNHNAGMGMDFFYDRLHEIRGYPLDPTTGAAMTAVPIFLFLYIAGFWGADGSVGMTGWAGNGESKLTQSCKPYLESIAKILNEVLTFPDGHELEVTEQSSKKRSSASRRKYQIFCNLQQVERIIFPIGSFDYNRRSQWAVLLLLIMVQKDQSIPPARKEKLVRFLKDLLIIIKILRPSKGKRRIIINVNGVTISDQTIAVYSP